MIRNNAIVNVRLSETGIEYRTLSSPEKPGSTNHHSGMSVNILDIMTESIYSPYSEIIQIICRYIFCHNLEENRLMIYN